MKYLTRAYVKYLEEKRSDDVKHVSASEIMFEDATYVREADGLAFMRVDA